MSGTTNTLRFARLIVGCDHGGYELKKVLLDYVAAKYSGLEVLDVGCKGSDDRVDYPDIAGAVCSEVLSPSPGGSAGILVCGSGIGISIAANKVNGIRCALCHDYWTAKMCREHNDANIMALGGRCTGPEPAKQMVDAFFETPFEGGRHCGRVDKIHALEQPSTGTETAKQ